MPNRPTTTTGGDDQVARRAMTLLDRSSPLPLWAQLENALRRRLDAGEFAERFPTDLEVASAYDVSRHTVREAIRSLNRHGVLQRRRGRGTVVSGRFDQPLGALYSLFRSVEAQGVEQSSKVVQLSQVVDTRACAALGIEALTPLLYLERIRFAADEPLAVDRAWLPMSIARPLLDVDFSRTALYDELEARCHIRPTRGWERITPELPDAQIRAALDIGARTAIFRLERGTSAENTPLEYRETFIRGDRYRFITEWTERATSAINAQQIEALPADRRVT